jgi:DNA-binding beta-propeller fold protein YncE
MRSPVSQLIFAICMTLAFALSCVAEERPYCVLVVEETLGRVTILASDDPQRRVSIPVGYKPHEITVSLDGKTAYVSNFGLSDANNREGIAGSTITAIDIRSASVRQEFRLPGSLKAPHGLGFRPRHETELFTNAEQGDQMVVFDSHSGQVKRAFPLPNGIHNFVFSSDGLGLFAFSPKGIVYRIDPDNGKLQANQDIGSPVRGIGWMKGNEELMVSSMSEITILQKSNLSIIRKFRISDSTQFFYSAATPDGRFILAPAVYDGDVTVLNASNGDVYRRIHTGTPLRVIVSPDSNLVYVTNVGPVTNHITVISLPLLNATVIYDIRDSNGLSFSTVVPVVFTKSRTPELNR